MSCQKFEQNKDFICTLNGFVFRILKFSISGNNSNAGQGVYSRRIELGSDGGGGENEGG